MHLFLLAQQGDTKAQALLTEQHMPLVYALSKRFPYSEDAIQEGCMGLFYAIMHFNTSLNFCFSSYAVPCILNSIKKYFLPSNNWRINQLYHKKNAIMRDFLNTQNTSPTVQQVKDKIGEKAYETLFLLDQFNAPFSLYDEKYERTLKDPSAQDFVHIFMLKDILYRLPPDEKTLIFLRYYKNKTQAECAKHFALSQSAFCRKEKRILNKIRSEYTC